MHHVRARVASDMKGSRQRVPDPSATIRAIRESGLADRLRLEKCLENHNAVDALVQRAQAIDERRRDLVVVDARVLCAAVCECAARLASASAVGLFLALRAVLEAAMRTGDAHALGEVCEAAVDTMRMHPFAGALIVNADVHVRLTDVVARGEAAFAVVAAECLLRIFDSVRSEHPVAESYDAGLAGGIMKMASADPGLFSRLFSHATRLTAFRRYVMRVPARALRAMNALSDVLFSHRDQEVRCKAAKTLRLYAHEYPDRVGSTLRPCFAESIGAAMEDRGRAADALVVARALLESRADEWGVRLGEAVATAVCEIMESSHTAQCHSLAPSVAIAIAAAGGCSRETTRRAAGAALRSLKFMVLTNDPGAAAVPGIVARLACLGGGGECVRTAEAAEWFGKLKETYGWTFDDECRAPVFLMEPADARPDACAICIEDMSTGGVTRTGCGHAFHLSCLRKWTATKVSCPECRSTGVDPVVYVLGEAGSTGAFALRKRKLDGESS